MVNKAMQRAKYMPSKEGPSPQIFRGTRGLTKVEKRRLRARRKAIEAQASDWKKCYVQ
ncbi:hypothetical protein CCACVL1_11562 [Corchorus capsularis]|uniref:Uncharacterized protein n=1 Tax=Corchorus capsularis TaxID=210143 RepID=A0A1R3IKJ9_COCAP|nr:hypothetical protein CCACVL1_11562 [Corchorus capsularis]